MIRPKNDSEVAIHDPSFALMVVIMTHKPMGSRVYNNNDPRADVLKRDKIVTSPVLSYTAD